MPGCRLNDLNYCGGHDDKEDGSLLNRGDTDSWWSPCSEKDPRKQNHKIVTPTRTVLAGSRGQCFPDPGFSFAYTLIHDHGRPPR